MKNAPSRLSRVEATPWRWRFALLAPVVGVLYAGYQIVNRWHWRPPVYLPLTALDRAIPLIEWTIWPYLFLAWCMGLILFVRKRAIFVRALWALVIAYPIDLLIFAVFPTVYPRVADTPGAGWNRLAFEFLFAVDTPANCFPSGHITAPFIAFWALAADNPRWRSWLWLTFAALCPTILTTKQHYVADLMAGLAVGIFGVWASGRKRRPTGGGKPERLEASVAR